MLDKIPEELKLRMSQKFEKDSLNLETGKSFGTNLESFMSLEISRLD